MVKSTLIDPTLKVKCPYCKGEMRVFIWSKRDHLDMALCGNLACKAYHWPYNPNPDRRMPIRRGEEFSMFGVS